MRKEDEKKRQEESKKINEWSNEELSSLSKAIVRFPAGAPRRWENITEYVGTRT